MYKFRRASEDEISVLENKGFCKICSVYDILKMDETLVDEKFALFYGKLRTVFGEPDYTSDDYENMYSYWITAEDGQNKLYLEVYHGPSGASVGGKPFDISKEQEKVYMNAAEQLIALIESANPSNYVWEGIYEDTSENVRYTVKGGKAYIESEFSEDDMDF